MADQYQDTLSGGLQTRDPAHRVQPSESPDMLNVLLHNGAVEKRAGFRPVTKTHAKLGGVLNRGYHAQGTLDPTSIKQQAEFLSVSGAMYAAHRKEYESLEDFVIDFVFSPTSLLLEHGGNGFHENDAEDDVFGGGPYPIDVRPLVSKGPVKKTLSPVGLDADNADFNGPAGAAIDFWDVANPYGNDSSVGSGLPFAIYLRRDLVSGDKWFVEAAANVFQVATLPDPTHKLEQVRSTTEILPGGFYHVVFSFSANNEMLLRVGLGDASEKGYRYETGSAAVGDIQPSARKDLAGWAQLTFTPTPIQVFDCPQHFIEGKAAIQTVSSGIVGLGYERVSPTGGGGYFTRCKRFEGQMEDLIISMGKLLDNVDTTLDKLAIRLNPRNYGDPFQSRFRPINFWSMTQGDEYSLTEELGQQNDLFMAPLVPIPTGGAGGRETEVPYSWWFNGQTSYACAKNYEAVWRDTEAIVEEPNLPVKAWMRQVLRENAAFGLEVDFRPASTAERYHQVLAEIDGVMRLSINTEGKLEGVVRGTVNNYQAVSVVSTERLIPGQRYNVTLWWEAGSPNRNLELYVSHLLNATAVTAVMPYPIENMVPGPLLVGMGVRQFTTKTADAVDREPDDQTWGLDRHCMDNRSGFVGYIEQVKIVCGQVPAKGLPVGQHRWGYKEETPDDWRHRTHPIFTVPTSDATRDSIISADGNATILPIQRGHLIRAGAPDQLAGKRTPVLMYDNGFLLIGIKPDYPDIINSGMVGIPAGTTESNLIATEFYYVAFAWRFNGGKLTFNLDNGAFSLGANVRPSIAPDTLDTGSVDYFHGVYEKHSSEVTELTGNAKGMDMLQRCLEPEIISQAYEGTHTGGASSDPGYDKAQVQNALRPYPFRSPQEMAPTYIEGLQTPNINTNPVCLLTDWHHQRSGERLTIAGCGKTLYWARPLWRADSPFNEAEPFSLWGGMFTGDFIHCHNTDLEKGTFNNDDPATSGEPNLVHLDFWIKPHKIDGTRLICARRGEAPTIDDTEYNYVVALLDGTIAVAGVHDQSASAGDSHTWWMAREGTAETTSCIVKCNAWNHVHIRFGRSGIQGGVTVWVNGEKIPMHVPAMFTVPGDNADDVPLGVTSSVLNLVGLERGKNNIFFVNDGSRWENVDFFSGLISEFRQYTGVDALWVDQSTQQIPYERYESDAGDDNEAYLFHCNEGYGWLLTNSASNRLVPAEPQDSHGNIRIQDLLPINQPGEVGDIRVVGGQRWDSAVFRDRLYLTNGRDRPLELIFTGFSDPGVPITVQPMGMKVGMRPPRNEWRYIWSDAFLDIFVDVDETSIAAASPYILFTGIYSLWCSFFDADGRESEPMFLEEFEVPQYEFEITASAPGPITTLTVDPDLPTEIAIGQRFIAWIELDDGSRHIGTATKTAVDQFTIPVETDPPPKLNGVVLAFPNGIYYPNLPRSTDPQCVGRRIYFSPLGGGVPIHHSDIHDNVTATVEMLGSGSGASVPDPGQRLVPNRAKHITVGAGSLIMGNFPDLPAGGGALQWSSAAEPTYFPFTNAAVIDSEDGEVVTGLKDHLGRQYAFKRSSTWQLDLFRGTLSVVNQSEGVGGGAAVQDNVIFGAGERGVGRFDGANMVYASKALEGYWRGLPITDDDLIRMRGAYHREQSQYWLLVRDAGDFYSKTALVLHTQIGDGQAWAKLEIPPASYLANVVDAVTQRPGIVIGTAQGQLLRYTPGHYVDGQENLPGFATGKPALLSGVTDPSTSVVNGGILAPAGDFWDNAGDGLRGVPIYVKYTVPNGYARPGDYAETRIVQRNDFTALRFDEPLSGLIGGEVIGGLEFWIGVYDAYWSSGWMGSPHPGRFRHFHEVGLEFEPSECSLTVESQAAIGTTPRQVGQATDRPLPPGREGRAVQLTDGVLIEPVFLKAPTRGRYFRVVFRTSRELGSGLFNPWAVTGWWLSYKDETVRGRQR